MTMCRLPDSVWIVMAAYNEFGAKAGAAGVIGGGEALQPPKTAVGIKVDGKGGAITRTDAPFAEAKEVVGGFYLLDCADIDEAINWASQIPGAWLGRVVVQPAAGPPVRCHGTTGLSGLRRRCSAEARQRKHRRAALMSRPRSTTPAFCPG